MPKVISLKMFSVLIIKPDSHTYSDTVIKNNCSTRYRHNTLPNTQPEKYDTKSTPQNINFNLFIANKY
jgi:hypothetical protein